MFEVFLLLALFQLKHFICDYPLQNEYMLGKMKSKDWIKPLASHTFVHAVGTLTIVYWFFALTISSFNYTYVLISIALGFADFCLHFVIDRIKASPNLGGRWKPNEPKFWWALGADQMAHHLVNYIFIYILVTSA